MGKVLSKEKVIVPQKLPGIETTIYHRYYKFTFTIECKYKGKIKTDTVEIITGVGDGDCGYNFEIGKNYVVYSNWKKKYFREGSKVSKFLYTDICTRTTELVKKEDTEIKKHKKLCKQRVSINRVNGINPYQLNKKIESTKTKHSKT